MPTLNELIETGGYLLIKDELDKGAIPDEKSLDLALKTRNEFIIDLLIIKTMAYFTGAYIFFMSFQAPNCDIFP